MSVEFTPIRLLVLSIFALWIGAALNRRITVLRRFSIPLAVTGGLICAVVCSLVDSLTPVSFVWDMALRDELLLMFFSGVGMSAKLNQLKQGGRLFARLALLTVLFLVVQNLVGMGVAVAIGRNPAYGLVCGSIAFAGGHGTAITWGQIAAEWGYPQVLSHGIAFATFGLIFGGLVGGPLASRLIGKRHLATARRTEVPISGEVDEEEAVPLTPSRFLRTLLVFAICIGAGAELNELLAETGAVLPGFVTAMLVGVVLTNVADLAGRPLHAASIGFMSEVSLHLFLAMSLVSLELAHLGDALLPVALAVGAQIVFALVFARWLVFRFCGADYNAAVLATGFVGIGLGATPVGMANMDAVTRRFQPAPSAMLVLPLIGAGVLDITNALVIDVYLRILM
ncbi:MAG: sodium/glutamate symporter [Planctomycetota bacterium]|jgi:ESS family glutamate:Na+ symporter